MPLETRDDSSSNDGVGLSMMIPSPLIASKLGVYRQGTVKSDDHAELLFQVFGQGPAVVLANGIGVNYPALLEQINALRDRYQVICWDYRGMGQSVMIDPEGDVSMSRHAMDIMTILDHLAVESAVLVGWSMGVQVALEVIRCFANRTAGLVALLGGFGHPFQAALPGPLSRLVEGGFQLLHRFPLVAQGLLDLAVAVPSVTLTLLRHTSFVSADVDRELFEAAVRSVAGTEKKLYLRTMLSLAKHDASDVLPKVRCPSLVICGTRDYLTPPKVARAMVRQISGAEYREVEGGTHYALIEKTSLVNGWLRDFVDRVYAGQ
jgi:3-oxoadipate enol-lactonase